MRLFLAWMTVLVMAGSILQPQAFASHGDKGKVYQDVLIKINTTTVLQGKLEYTADDQVTLTTADAAPGDVVDKIVAATRQNKLFINAIGASATHPDFHHKHIAFVGLSADKTIWTFHLLEAY